MSSYLCVYACIDLFFPRGNGMLVYMCILIFMFRLSSIHIQCVSNTHETGIPKKNNTRSLFFPHATGLDVFFRKKVDQFLKRKANREKL